MFSEFLCRQVLSGDADQRGSLVAPERLRFDFTNKAAMKVGEVKKVEDIANQMIDRNQEMFAKEAPLAVAKTIQGLRAVFDETYPDPVRVVSVGIPVETLETDPNSPEGTKTSVEFCGGTHLRRAGHMQHMIIASEEAIAKGIRRIVALTGPEAAKALAKEKLLTGEVGKLKENVCNKDLSVKEKVKLITDLGYDIDAAVISYAAKDNMRNNLKSIKKVIDDEARAKKAAVLGEVVEATKVLLAANPGLTYLVHNLAALADNKAVDGALKQVKAVCPDTPTMFISADEDSGKILAMAQCSKQSVAAGLKANEWCASVIPLIGGKGGGKPESAQASGANTAALQQALEAAEQFAMEKLGVSRVSVAVSSTATPAGDSTPVPVPAGPGVEVTCVADSPACQAVLASAALAGLPARHSPGPGFTARFSGGVELVEPVSAILLAGDATLAGVGEAVRAELLAWLLYCAGDLRHSVAAWLAQPANPGPRQDCLARLAALNTQLATRTFLVGERLSLADIGVATALLPAFTGLLDPQLRLQNRNTTRYLAWHGQILYLIVILQVVQHSCEAGRGCQGCGRSAALPGGSRSCWQEGKEREVILVPGDGLN